MSVASYSFCCEGDPEFGDSARQRIASPYAERTFRLTSVTADPAKMVTTHASWAHPFASDRKVLILAFAAIAAFLIARRAR